MIDRHDVIFAIDRNTPTEDGTSAQEWLERLGGQPTILKLIIRNRHEFSYTELVNELDEAIERIL